MPPKQFRDFKCSKVLPMPTDDTNVKFDRKDRFGAHDSR
ncbi:hypothetical protein CCACVL1_01758 [Corchorus capsularis]|uniref:Uncharacterized protein n=1 Tax=Corchorus capsularis TaxID=210143 RepID=A0A1R3KG46_COCAP|nr:hypothetical protein CCACVL1_01758 [Corchorus capsularis]